MNIETANTFWETEKENLSKCSLEAAVKSAFVCGLFAAEQIARDCCKNKGCETYRCADDVRQAVRNEL